MVLIFMEDISYSVLIAEEKVVIKNHFYKNYELENKLSDTIEKYEKILKIIKERYRADSLIEKDLKIRVSSDGKKRYVAVSGKLELLRRNT